MPPRSATTPGDGERGKFDRTAVQRGRRDQRRQHGRRHCVEPGLDARMDALETRQHQMAADARQIGHGRTGQDDPEGACSWLVLRPLSVDGQAAWPPRQRCRQVAPIEMCHGEPTIL